MLKDIAPKAHVRATTNARRLRGSMTLPEVILWQALRSRPNGIKFRRQHPTGPFILDFFCSDARLAIEIDGEAHARGDQPQRDADRDAWLRNAGIETLRIAACDVLKNADAAVLWIVSQAVQRLPLHHPARRDGPPTRGKLGEE